MAAARQNETNDSMIVAGTTYRDSLAGSEVIVLSDMSVQAGVTVDLVREAEWSIWHLILR